MKEATALNVNHRIALRIRDLRAARGLSLDALAAHSGVSRSMISLIERGESSPTAVLLEKLAAGLKVSMASIFEVPQIAAQPVFRFADQTLWRDPHSGYLRRNVSPGGAVSPIQIVEVLFPAQARVAYETGAREPVIYQQIWLLAGCMEISVGEEVHRLNTGDCLAHALDRPVTYHNPTQTEARYVVVIATFNAALDTTLMTSAARR